MASRSLLSRRPSARPSGSSRARRSRAAAHCREGNAGFSRVNAKGNGEKLRKRRWSCETVFIDGRPLGAAAAAAVCSLTVIGGKMTGNERGNVTERRQSGEARRGITRPSSRETDNSSIPFTRRSRDAFPLPRQTHLTVKSFRRAPGNGQYIYNELNARIRGIYLSTTIIILRRLCRRRNDYGFHHSVIRRTGNNGHLLYNDETIDVCVCPTEI